MIAVIEGKFTMWRQATASAGWIWSDVLGQNALARVFDTRADHRLDGWLGPESVTVRTSPVPIRGTRGNDALDGGSGNHLLYGGNGDDILYGRFGQDSLYGGRGQDSVFGNDGDDLVFGGLGNDLLVGDSLFDFMNPDQIDGGRDTVFGGAGDDRVFGRLNDDHLFGGAGHDFFIGGTGNDVIYGGAGNDRNLVSNGDDDMFGGSGNDTLTDGLGADDFTGGAGADSFVYLISDDVDRDEGGPTADYGVGDDRILDFNLAQRDTFVIDLSLANNVVVSDIVDDGTSTAFFISYGEVITLIGFSGQDFRGGLRFDSVDDINALSQQLYGYDAVVLAGFD
jgi:Ca2+-binding RTX toxin-like protein